MLSAGRIGLALFLPLALVLSAGCQKHDTTLASVHGKVYFHNEPLNGGTIVFTPDTAKGGHGAMARAEIKPDGSYALLTGPETGCVPGWHRITIMGVDQANQGIMLSLPRRFCDPELSGLSREVKDSEDNTIDLHLE
jgi:hypothetical protein